MSLLIPFNGLKLLRKVRITQAITKGVGHLSRIVPGITHKGTTASGSVVDAQNLILISGLIVLVTDINILCIYHILGAAQSIIQVCIREITEVLHSCTGKGACSPGIRQMTRDVRRTDENICNADKAIVTCSAKDKTGIHAILRVFNPLQIHSKRTVNQYNSLLKAAAFFNHFKQIRFFRMEGKHGNTIRIPKRIQIYALTSITAEKNKCDIIIIRCKAIP